MDKLVSACSEYIGDPKYVFKSCGKYIVVLEKLPDTITNESRSNISDPIYAKYRANKLRVVLIINKFDQSDIIKEIENTFYHKKIRYEKDKIVEVYDHDMKFNEVYTEGIHYFRTIEQAFYWQLFDFNLLYTGKYIQWYEEE